MFKGPETLNEKLWRFRGVICCVVIVPVTLLSLVFLLIPMSFPVLEHALTLSQLQHSHGQKHAPNRSFTSSVTFQHGGDIHQVPNNSINKALTGSQKVGGSKSQFVIVIDAGSTGSRVHIFRFEMGTDSLSTLHSDTFKQLKPGLSAFPDDPAAAAASLKPLMETALITVPKEIQASTPVFLKATAGLRLLPGDKADRILEAVRQLFKGYPFSLSGNSVSILGGHDEAGFSWLSLNYLLNNFGADPDKTVATIDLGGGSVQEAFALTEKEAATAPPGYVSKLKVGGRTYHVYVHSYLGYGLLAARAKLIDVAKAMPVVSHPCGFSGTFSYGGSNHTWIGAGGPVLDNTTSDDSSFDKCSGVVMTALDSKTVCGSTQDPCSFSGVWRGPTSHAQRSNVLLSYFWDRAIESEVIGNMKDVKQSAASPQDFSEKARQACTSSGESGKVIGTSSFMCMDLSYIHTLLTHGFKIPQSTKFMLVKQVEYRGQTIEAAWPLGAAINELPA